MIYTLNYPSTPIERVNQVVYEFIKNSIPNGNYSRSLFPNWFHDVLANSRAKEGNKSFEDKFEETYTEIQALPQAVRQNIFNEFEQGLDIKSLCEDKSIPVILTEQYSVELHKKLKVVLKDHFYGSALAKNKTIQGKLSTTLREHYISFKDANKKGRVCPFCGLHNYALKNGEAKDDYDHWLYKSKYPLYAVNFSNLVPMCDKCNQGGVKGITDVIHDENGTRRESFYPYDVNSGVSIIVNNFTPPYAPTYDRGDEFPYGYYQLDITYNDVTEAEKVETWKTVFKIEERFNSFLSEYNNSIKDDFHEIYLPSHLEHSLNNDASNLRSIVHLFQSQLGSKYRKTGVLIDKAYLDFICRSENTHMLYTFCDINLMMTE